MAKDPRFNFYVDNWIGGTEGFTLEQEGAYLSLIIMQSKVGRFTKEQAMDKLLQKTRGDAAACARLWIFLLPKFSRENDLFWSERLENEMAKSKIHSEKQSERAKKRYNKNPASAAAVPVSIGTGSGIGSVVPEEGVQGEKFSDHWFSEIFDSLTVENIRGAFREHDLDNEFKIFRLKVRGSPKKYGHRDAEGIRQAFIYQLSNSNGNRKSNKKSPRRADAIIEPPTSGYGNF